LHFAAVTAAAVVFTFTNVSLSEESPDQVGTVVAIRRFVEVLFEEIMAMTTRHGPRIVTTGRHFPTRNASSGRRTTTTGFSTRPQQQQHKKHERNSQKHERPMVEGCDWWLNSDPIRANHSSCNTHCGYCLDYKSTRFPTGTFDTISTRFLL